jgi:septal ring factor EnvC (AmiA/AmiB activator)
MELLKKSIDNNTKITYLNDFIHNDLYIKWSFPFKNKQSNDFLKVKHKAKKNKEIEEVKEEIEEVKQVKEEIEEVKEEIEEVKQVKQVKEEVKEEVKQVKEEVKEVKEQVKEEVKEVKEVKEEIEEVKEEIEEVKKVKEMKDIEKGLKPIDLLRELYTLNGENYEVNRIIQDFLSKKEVSMKFTKKVTSEIMQNLNENKWNINVCKLISILIEKPILYRKKIINDNNYEGESYII